MPQKCLLKTDITFLGFIWLFCSIASSMSDFLTLFSLLGLFKGSSSGLWNSFFEFENIKFSFSGVSTMLTGFPILFIFCIIACCMALLSYIKMKIIASSFLSKMIVINLNDKPYIEDYGNLIRILPNKYKKYF